MLCAATQLPPGALTQCFCRQPRLAKMPSEPLAAAAARLQRLPGLGPARALHAMLALPSLLLLAPDTVAARWRCICGAAERHDRWAAQLERLRGSTLGAMLVQGSRRHARLEYLLSSAGAEDSSKQPALSTVLLYPEAKFAMLCPKYMAWRQQRTANEGSAG